MASRTELGDVVDLTLDVAAAGAPVDPTTISIRITAPDGTISTPGVARTGLGTYVCSLIPTQVGEYRYRWTTTGVAQGAEDGRFVVHDPYTSVITVAEVKTELNKLSTRDDEEIQDFIDAAVTAIEKRTGPLTPTAVTGERHEGGDTDVLLRREPVLSVTSVTEYSGSTSTVLTERPLGSSLDGWQLDAPTGCITRVTSAGYDTYFNVGTVVVDYVVGRQTLSPMLRRAVLLLVDHLWTSSQSRLGGRPQPGGATTPGERAGTVHALPFMVEELLEGELTRQAFG